MTDPRHAEPREQPPEGVHLRQIKSYVLRAGRMGPGQQRAFEQFGPRFLLAYDAGQRLDPVAVFGRSAPLIMEIGFGMGGATAHIAQVRPDDNFLCCEVHEPGVGALLKLCGEQDIGNIRIFQPAAFKQCVTYAQQRLTVWCLHLGWACTHTCFARRK